MRRLFILFAAFPMLLCGCSSFDEQNDTPIQPSMKEVQAGFAKETRTYVENERLLRWHEDDRLTVFYGNTLNDQYKFKGKTGDNSGTFSLVPSGELGTGNTLPNIYGIYPYNEDARITDDGIITYSLPAIQSYAENSFGKGANTMIAVTENLNDTFLSFRNLCGYLKLKLYGNATIKSIEVKGNFAEKIAGDAAITAAYGETPIVEMNTKATQTITLDCGEGVTLGTSAENATTFWIVIPETTFKYGITITATSTDNKVFTKSTSNSVIIERNTPTPMSALEFVGEKTEITPIAPSTIVYTTDDGNIVDLYTTEGFGSEYVSNVYDKESNIGTITFAGDISTIPAEAFLVCSNLTSIQIPNTVTTIAEKAFYGCNYMEKIIIPESVTNIAETAFEGCSGEAHILCNVNDKAFVGALFTKVVMDDNVTSIGKSAFASCYNLKEVVLPKGITKLEYCTFIYCTSLEKIVNADNITHIADGVFAEAGIVNISLPNVDYIGERAFEYCTYLNEIQLSESMSHIGSGAFNHCSLLNKITIPEGITTLYKDTFNYCSKLEAISLPSTLTTLYGSFYGCTSINRVDIKNFEMWCNLEIVQSEGYLGGCTPLDDSNGGDIYVNGDKLINVTFPNNITNIRDDLLMNCTSIESVTFGSRVSKIGSGAFNGCTNLSNIYLPKSIISIGASAFKNTSLSCVDIPAGVTIISAQTFSGCKQLKEANLPSTIREIGERAFNECVELSQLNLPTSVTAIGGGAFNNCKNITAINIPNNVKSIGEAAFAGLEKITSIVIPDGVTFIQGSCFKGCINLTNVILPHSIEKIGNWAFDNCKSLSSISLPESLISIGQYAFNNCPISTITIPSNVSRIENSAFNNCPLIEMYCKPKKVPYIQGAMSSYLFRGIIYVPRASEELYKAEWSPMADRIVGYDFNE